MVNLLLVRVRMLMLPSPKNLRWKLLLRWRRFVFLAFILKWHAHYLTLIGLTSPVHDFMRSNRCPVCLCADNMPFCHFLTSRPYLSLWLDDGYNNAICHLFCIFSRGVFLFSIYLFLIAILANYSNPINVLKIPRRAIVVCNRPFLLISLVTPHPLAFGVVRR